MCDPFNTSTKAALWDERNDLDPFMAEHYANNAQHELDRTLAASRPDQQRIAHIRRLLGSYHALAALARLPEDSDFDYFEAQESVESEGMASVHPDRLALVGSAGEEATASSSSPTRGRPVSATRTEGEGDGSRSRSRESSVESITREDGLGDHGHGQQNYGNRNRNLRTQQWSTQQPLPQQQVPPQQLLQQQILQQEILQRQILEQQFFQQQLLQQQLLQQQLLQQQLLQQRVPPPVYNPLLPQQMTAYCPPPQSIGYYQPLQQSVVPYQQPNYTNMAIAAIQDVMQYTNGGSITFSFGPTVIHQSGPNIPQPQRYGNDHGSYDGGYDEILGGRRTRRGRRSRRGRR
jgi:hypothetical protein